MTNSTTLRFVQLADPQFGQFARFSGIPDEEIERFQQHKLNVKKASKITHFKNEEARFSLAIERAIEADPAFVVVCGDMINTPGAANEVAAVKRISAGLPETIPIFWTPGNHDVCGDTVRPTDESIAMYRADFGDDYHSFDHDDSTFIVLNSCVLQRPEAVPRELDSQMRFVESTLWSARRRGAKHIVAFTHHPLFLDNPEEPDEDLPFAPSPPNQKPGYWTIPLQRRMPLLELFREYGVEAVFSGHWHRNHYTRDGDMLMISTGAVGYPLGDDPSGYRIVDVTESGVQHTYHTLDV
ncbi:MAG: metallophosphoesterase [Chloroflexi bacterium]|nr:metallophosphoesterase [Chloroflexota bacterium]